MLCSGLEVAIVKCASKFFPPVLQWEARPPLDVAERGTHREARIKSRYRGTRSISRGIEDSGCGSGPVAPPISFTGGHDLPEDVITCTHCSHTTHYPVTKP